MTDAELDKLVDKVWRRIQLAPHVSKDLIKAVFYATDPADLRKLADDKENA